MVGFTKVASEEPFLFTTGITLGCQVLSPFYQSVLQGESSEREEYEAED